MLRHEVIENQAANVVEWAEHPEFLGLKHKLWPVQKNVLVDTFQDECWPCSERLAEEWKGDLREFPSILFKHGVCPMCGGRKVDGHPIRIRESVGAWGHRTGKGWTTVVAATYQLHRALTRGNLANYYGLSGPTFLDLTLVDHSRKYLWGPFLQMWNNSPWQKMMGLNRSNTVSEILYPDQSVRIQAAGSDRDCRGSTGIFGAIDEYAWSKQMKVDGPKVRQALLNTFTTVNSRLSSISDPDPLDPKLVMFSSPNWDSKDLAILCRKKQYWRTVSRHATWEVNPEMSKEDLLAECGGDTERFRRDFAAELPT